MPRNKIAAIRARELYAAVTFLVIALRCPCCGKAPSAKAVQDRLPSEVTRSLKTISKHIAKAVKELKEIDAPHGTVSTH